MKRALHGSRILYVERHRLWSMLLLVSGLLLLVFAPEAFRRGDRGFGGVLSAGGLALCAAAVAYLGSARVLVIDREAGELRVLTRRAFRAVPPCAFPLKSLRVRVLGRVSGQPGTKRPRTELQDVLVEGPGGSVDVVRGLSAPAGENWGRRLAEDLGCEMVRDTRDVW